ncbi:NAD(P)H-dependent oxidoreductase [Priestia koreensis]|uniref:NAD(P)H-dependent oxidoreductase n=1 Tax=Priestia koreensis TaxID=284581 RepID=UPI001F5760C6|nr:NAD(P)H-dependent oxidoreductase [Priestia koreensis]MCM3003523.1 NAD(P)H-dependent oxidoreductase [Priestia koreensis]UNL86316.1 NAD(P)H-dependent oxidoreductase [Priestia koreensis]
MKNILIINGHEAYKKSKGTLNQTIFEEMSELLKSKFELKQTIVDDHYSVDEEIEKWKWADVIIMQTPVYWFSIPGKFKHYIDEVYMDNIFFKGSTRYGQGGQFTDKQYMYSLTWNAPEAIFDNPNAFYEGKSLDEAIFHLHKMNQYIGMSPLPTFSIHDVVKNPNMDHFKAKLKHHLEEVFEI